MNKTWRYNTLQAFIYPPAGPCVDRPDIILGDVSPGQWNNGTGCGPEMEYGCYLKNTGNIRINITWNSTNFTRSGGPADQFIGMEGDNFAIDDDFENSESPETRDLHVFMSAYPDFTEKQFFPDYNSPGNSGVRRCKNTPCDTDEEYNTGAFNKAKYNITWHIEVPSALMSGEYNNTIEITSRKHYGNW